MPMDADLITLSEATKHFPAVDGKKIHVLTLKRRIVKGVGGVKLRATKDGRRWFTTVEWIREFREACTAMACGRRRAAPNASHQKQIRQGLAELGILGRW